MHVGRVAVDVARAAVSPAGAVAGRDSEGQHVVARTAYESEHTDLHFTPPNDRTNAAAFGDIHGDVDLVVGDSAVNGDERVFVNSRACSSADTRPA